MHYTQHRCHGFTLLELLQVIFIGLILAGVSLPAFSSFSQKLKLQQTIDLLSMELRHVRKDAIDRQQDIIFSLQQAETYWCVGYTSKKLSCDCRINEDCERTSHYSHKDGITLQQARFAGGDAFSGFESSHGMALISGRLRNGSLWIRNQKDQKAAIIISRLGRIRTCHEGESTCPDAP